MKLRYLIILLLIVLVSSFCNSIYSQELFVKIPAKNTTAKNVKTLDFGDSLLLRIGFLKYIINKNGEISPSNFSTVDKFGNSIIEIIRYGNEYFTYSLSSQNGNSMLIVEKNGSSDSTKKFELTGDVLSVFKHVNLHVLVFEKKRKQLKIIEIEKASIQNENVYMLPFDLSPFKPSETQYIHPKQHILLSEAASRMKIFIEERKLILVADEPYQTWFDDANKFSKTIICTFDLDSNDFQIRSILEPSHVDFRSFYFDGLIYRISYGSRKFELKVFDSRDNQINYFSFDKTPALKKQKVYFREGTANLVSKEESLHHMMKTVYLCKPFLIVENTLENKPFVTWGTYYNGKGFNAPTLGPTVPLVFNLAVAATRTAIKQSMEGPGISRYFYLTKSESEKYQIANNEMIIPRAVIDRYEISAKEKGLKFRLKGYSNFGDFFLGIYQYHDKDSIEIINYGNLYK